MINPDKKIVKKFQTMPWEVWLKRQFPVLVAYLMIKNATKAAFAKQGIKGQWPIVLFEDKIWYGNKKMFSLAGREAKKYLRKTDAHFLVKICERGYKLALAEIEKINRDNKTSPLKQYQKVISLLEPVNVSIWTAHASEVYYHQELRKRLAKYAAPKNIEKFIGDIGFPAKKNAHALMIEDILNGVSARNIYKKYSWLKSRIDAGFGGGYTLQEMKNLVKDILKNPPIPVTHPPIPNGLNNLVNEFRDIVYLRTLRTDALFEIYFRAQPIFARVAKYFKIDSVAHYLPEDLLKGEVKRYSGHFAILKYYNQVIVTKEKIAQDAVVAGADIKGVVAFAGQATGRVKIVFRPSEIGKVNEGDILVTNMTIPAYLSAMKKSAGIVTDEGGITCHAAILAREMKKPCVIGAKIATKVLKDGDLVEVDAEKGVVRKIR